MCDVVKVLAFLDKVVSPDFVMRESIKSSSALAGRVRGTNIHYLYNTTHMNKTTIARSTSIEHDYSEGVIKIYKKLKSIVTETVDIMIMNH